MRHRRLTFRAPGADGDVNGGASTSRHCHSRRSRRATCPARALRAGGDHARRLLVRRTPRCNGPVTLTRSARRGAKRTNSATLSKEAFARFKRSNAMFPWVKDVVLRRFAGDSIQGLRASDGEAPYEDNRWSFAARVDAGKRGSRWERPDARWDETTKALDSRRGARERLRLKDVTSLRRDASRGATGEFRAS